MGKGGWREKPSWKEEVRLMVKGLPSKSRNRNAKEPLRGALLCHLVQVASFIKKGTRLYATDHSP